MAEMFGGGPADDRLTVFRSRRAARNWLLGRHPLGIPLDG
jgi:hypothetical protein